MTTKSIRQLPRYLLFTLLVLFGGIASEAAIAQQIWTVDAANPTPGSGLIAAPADWSNSASKLEDVLYHPLLQTDDVILLAHGVYIPDVNNASNVPPGIASPTSRDHTFLIPRPIKIYGGYLGTQGGTTTTNSTDPLSPDGNPNGTYFWGDVGVPRVKSDNHYHLVYLDGSLHPDFLTSNAELRDLHVYGGAATGTQGLQGVGGGIVVVANAVLECPRNVTVWGNHALLNGGGIYCHNGSLRIARSVIHSNYSEGEGGGVWYRGAGMLQVQDEDRLARLVNLDVRNNTAAADGGGLYIGDAMRGIEGPGGIIPGFHFTNSLVRNNIAHSYGGGILIGSFSAQFITDYRHITVAGNESWLTGGGIYGYKFAHAHLCNSIVQANIGGKGLVGSIGPQADNLGLGVDFTVGVTGPVPTRFQVHHCSIGEGPYVNSFDPNAPFQDPPQNAGNYGVSWYALPNYGNIIGDDPLFANASMNDYSLSVGSTCLDVGADDHLVPDDLDIDENPATTLYLPLDFRLVQSNGLPSFREQTVTLQNPNAIPPQLGSIVPVAGGANGSFTDLGCFEHKWEQPGP